jgi:hypothetical protein
LSLSLTSFRKLPPLQSFTQSTQNEKQERNTQIPEKMRKKFAITKKINESPSYIRANLGDAHAEQIIISSGGFVTSPSDLATTAKKGSIILR